MRKDLLKRLLSTVLTFVLVIPLAWVPGMSVQAEESVSDILIQLTDVSIVPSSVEGKVDANGALLAGSSFDIIVTATAQEDIEVSELYVDYAGAEHNVKFYDEAEYIWNEPWVMKAGVESTYQMTVTTDEILRSDTYLLDEVYFATDEYDNEILYTRSDADKMQAKNVNNGYTCEVTWDDSGDIVVENENSDTSVPVLTAVKRTPVDGIETDTQITYEFTYSEEGTGVEDITAEFVLVGTEDDKYPTKEYFYQSYENTGECSGSGTVKATSELRKEGTYILSSVSIADFAGNKFSYQYDKTEDKYFFYINGKLAADQNIALDIDDTFTVAESSKPIEQRAIIIEDIRISGDSKAVNAPGKVEFELDIKAPADAEIYGVDLEYYSVSDGKKIELYGEPAKGESDWKPGTAGSTIKFSADIDGYITTGDYKLISVYFYRDDDGEDYGYERDKNSEGEYLDTFTGESSSKINKYQMTYDASGDFMVASSLGVDSTAPYITSLERVPAEGIEVNTEITYKVKYVEEGSGLYSISMVYETEDGDWDAYSYNVDENGELETKGEITLSSKLRSKGEYTLSYIVIMDKAGNGIWYEYSKKDGCYVGQDESETEYKLDVGAAATYSVAPSSIPAADSMIILADIRISNESKNQLKTPASLVMDISATAPEGVSIEDIELYFYSEKIEDYLYISKSLIDKPWAPGPNGDTYQLTLDFHGYEVLDTYELAYLEFYTVGSEYPTYYEREVDKNLEFTNVFVGENMENMSEYEYTYNGEADFTITEHMGIDTTAPIITSVKRNTKGDILPDTEVSFTVEFEEKESGIDSIGLYFFSDKEGMDIYSYWSEGKLEGNSITLTSSKRAAGKYELYAMEIYDKSGNSTDYYYNEDTGVLEMTSDYENYVEVDIPVDNKYTVIEEHEHKYVRTVVKDATFTKNGLSQSICKCGKVKEGSDKTIAKVSNVKLSYTIATYSGKAKKPTVTVKDANGKALDASDYSVTYAKGRTKVGTYKVTVKLKNEYSGTKTLTFKIQPKAPKNVKAVLYGHDDVKVSWKKSTGAAGYYVYYKKAGAKEYKNYKRTTGSSLKFANLSDGTKYDFKVVPYYTVSGERVKSTKSVVVNARTLKKLEAPAITRYSSKKVKVSWKNILGETGYQISRSTSKKGTYIVATYKTTTGKSKTLTVTRGKTYYYKVRAYRTVNGKKIYGPWSDAVKFKNK